MTMQDEIKALGQTVLVLQGGGALGAYQAGVFEALHEAGIEPDWVIGTSIGAINAALIAGNAPEQRVGRLREFWARVTQHPVLESWAKLPGFGGLAQMATIAGGIPAFFRPNPTAFFGQNVALSPEAAGYYSTAPLAETLGELVDFPRLAAGAPRLTVGAANLRTGAMRYFDSGRETLDVRHVLASGALPPAFPAVRIDGELYWDGGILSNTPVEAVFDDFPRRSSLVFAVHIWNPQGPEPGTIAEVLHRHKDLLYASRSESHIARQRELHNLRHIISELKARLPEAALGEPEVQAMAAFGCRTRMHVVRILAAGLENEDQAKDIDFSRAGIAARWQAGLLDTRRTLAARPWSQDFDPKEGFLLHQVRAETGGAAA